jgi:hypothetical protein
MEKKVGIILLISFEVIVFGGFAQSTSKPLPTTLPEKYWTWTNEYSLSGNQSYFSKNWKSGGVNNLAGSTVLISKALYKKKTMSAAFSGDFRFGLQKNVVDSFVRKTQDLIYLDGNYSHEINQRWMGFGSLNLVSQFSPGFEYANNRKFISSFLAPGYFTEAIGFQYKKAQIFNARMGLLAMKQSIVINEQVYGLVDTVRYGVIKGERIRNEVGMQLQVSVEKDIVKQLSFKGRYQGFVSYQEISQPKVFDHRVDILLTYKINRWLRFTGSIIVVRDVDQDPYIQFSQVLGLGLNYKF